MFVADDAPMYVAVLLHHSHFTSYFGTFSSADKKVINAAQRRFFPVKTAFYCNLPCRNNAYKYFVAAVIYNRFDFVEKFGAVDKFPNGGMRVKQIYLITYTP